MTIHRKPAGAAFINVDLEIRGRRRLDVLREALGREVVVLFCGRTSPSTHLLAVEVSSCQGNAEQVLRHFVRLIRKLPGPEAKAWSSASRRRFDFGIEGGRIGSETLTVDVSERTVKALADVGGEVGITVYPPAPTRIPKKGCWPMTTRPRARVSAFLASCAVLALGMAAAGASDGASGGSAADPFEGVRPLGVDGILVHTWKEVSRDPAMGDGVIWIDDARHVEELLRPLSATWGPQFACGYDVVFEFLKDGSVVAEHALNLQADCMEYATGVGSFVFRGDLAARWAPHLKRMRGPTGQWDVDIAFPVTMPFADARIAMTRAGLSVLDVGDDEMRRLPWVKLEHRAAMGVETDGEKELAAAGRPLIALASATCGASGCVADSPALRSQESSKDGRSMTVSVLVRFPERADIQPLLRAAAERGYTVAASHAPKDRYVVRGITTTRPTIEGCARVLASVDGALSVVAGSLGPRHLVDAAHSP